MAGRIGRIERAQDGQSYGFVIYDALDRACVYLGYPTLHQADTAARDVQGLLVTTQVCEKR
jgi:hypothetical protein